MKIQSSIIGLCWKMEIQKFSGHGISILRMWRRSSDPCECSDCKMDIIQEQMRSEQSEIKELRNSNADLAHQIQE